MAAEATMIKLLFLVGLNFIFIISSDATDVSHSLFKIEGKVTVAKEKTKHSEWMSDTTVLVDSGAYKGFLKNDGTFVINNIPSGSYLVEIASPNYMFDRFRIDINKGGKIRARQLNFLQPKAVHVVPYPLRFVATRQAPFFEIREQLKVKDFLFNPMVVMMILPVIFVFIMPKMMSMADPEAQKEMQSQMSKYNQKQMPDVSEYLSNLFSGGTSDAKKRKPLSADKGLVKKAGKRR